MTTAVRKWGNSYAIRLPKAAMERMRLSEGHVVRIVEDGTRNGFRIVPEIPVVSLKRLVRKITPKNRHTEIEWGGARGKEAW